MTKPSHPPIPPNCTHFKLEEVYRIITDGNGDEHESTKQEWFFYVSPSLSTYPTIHVQAIRVGMESDAIHRKEQCNVIASVARCAWLDEANRLEAEFCTDECGVVHAGMLCSDAYFARHGGEVNFDELLDAWTLAKSSIASARIASAAWAAWGRGEKWE